MKKTAVEADGGREGLSAQESTGLVQDRGKMLISTGVDTTGDDERLRCARVAFESAIFVHGNRRGSGTRQTHRSERRPDCGRRFTRPTLLNAGDSIGSRERCIKVMMNQRAADGPLDAGLVELHDSYVQGVNAAVSAGRYDLAWDLAQEYPDEALMLLVIARS